MIRLSVITDYRHNSALAKPSKTDDLIDPNERKSSFLERMTGKFIHESVRMGNK